MLISMLLLLSLAPSSLAIEAPNASPLPQSSMAKEKYLEAFKAGFAEKVCEEKTYFRKCFDAPVELCKKTSQTALASCLVELEKSIPMQLKLPSEGQAWGEKIGSCTGNRYEKELQAKKLPSAECKDASKWK